MGTWMKVNPIGVIVSAITYIVAGVLFYSHWAFGRFLTPLIKHMQKEADSRSVKVFFGAFVTALLIAYIMGCCQNLVRTKKTLDGALVGFLAWIGFVVPTSFSPVLFGKKPLAMFWLDALYYLIVYVAIGAITARFKKS